MKEIIEQLDDYSKWKEANGVFTTQHYIGAVCNFSHIVAISRLIFPDIVIISDCFFLKDSRQKINIKELWKNATTISDLEKMVNFICISSLTNLESEKNNEVLNEKIAIFLKDMWQYYLEMVHKDKNIEIQIYNDIYDGWCITVYQKDKLKHPKPDVLPEW